MPHRPKTPEQAPAAARRALRVVAGTVAAAQAASESGDTTAYYERIVTFARRIRDAGELSEIVRLLDQALDETHALHRVAALATAHRQVQAAETRIAELKQQVETVNGLLYVDHLTGALNRRGLEDAYQRESARADRTGKSLALALIDLDNFKLLNDRAGHVAGDRALTHVASILRATLRPQDVIARYGGEEFVILLSETSLADGLSAITRAREALAAAPLDLPRSTLAVTFSAGVAACHGEEALDGLLARADHALYGAKRAGKNQAYAAA